MAGHQPGSHGRPRVFRHVAPGLGLARLRRGKILWKGEVTYCLKVSSRLVVFIRDNLFDQIVSSTSHGKTTRKNIQMHNTTLFLPQTQLLLISIALLIVNYG